MKYILTIGNFDGVHLGHKALINEVISLSKKRKCSSKVITFNPYPFEFFKLNKKRILNQEDKDNIIQGLGIDIIEYIAFDEKIRSLSDRNFFDNFLKDRTEAIIVGRDFRFGKDRVGDIQSLLKLCSEADIDLIVFNDFEYDQQRVSSSRVRECLSNSLFEETKKLLGRPYKLTGSVKGGEKIGRKILSPTANIQIDNHDFCFSGVFLCKCGLEKEKFFGIANFGTKPTFDDHSQSLEVNLFNFSGNLYDKKLEVEFLCKIRDQIKFNNIEDLKDQIQIDITTAKSLIPNYE